MKEEGLTQYVIPGVSSPEEFHQWALNRKMHVPLIALVLERKGTRKRKDGVFCVALTPQQAQWLGLKNASDEAREAGESV